MPQTRLQKKTFASVVAARKTTDINIQDFLDLRQRMLDLQRENIELNSRISDLENKVHYLQTEGSKEVARTVLDECIASPPLELVTKVKEIVTETIELEVDDKVENQVLVELKEQKSRDKNAVKLRVAGLLDDWWGEDDTFEDTYLKITQSFQEIEWVEPKHITKIGQHAVITFENETDRLKILKQTRNLKGTKKWISEELTKVQLKQRASELEIVREARRNGKWAVYREGKAVVRDFNKRSNKIERGSQPENDVLPSGRMV